MNPYGLIAAHSHRPSHFKCHGIEAKPKNTNMILLLRRSYEGPREIRYVISSVAWWPRVNSLSLCFDKLNVWRTQFKISRGP